jgi:predicted small lipoprotein YifL
MFTQFKIVGLLGVFGTLSVTLMGCGQKGPLILPPAVTVKERPSPSTTSSIQDERTTGGASPADLHQGNR